MNDTVPPNEYAHQYKHVKVAALRRIASELDDLKVDPFFLSAEEANLLASAQTGVRSVAASIEERYGTT